MIVQVMSQRSKVPLLLPPRRPQHLTQEPILVNTPVFQAPAPSPAPWRLPPTVHQIPQPQTPCSPPHLGTPLTFKKVTRHYDYCLLQKLLQGQDMSAQNHSKTNLCTTDCSKTTSWSCSSKLCCCREFDITGKWTDEKGGGVANWRLYKFCKNQQRCLFGSLNAHQDRKPREIS